MEQAMSGARAIGLGLALGLMAGAAQAEMLSPSQALAQAVRPGLAPAPAVRLSLDPRSAEAHALKRAGVARTAIDRRLAGDDLTGALGFLCGIQPGADRNGAAAARGVDPSGRFVGAKLSLAFR
jgi:hypothetical protein